MLSPCLHTHHHHIFVHRYACFPLAHSRGWRTAAMRTLLATFAWLLGSTTRIWGKGLLRLWYMTNGQEPMK